LQGILRAKALNIVWLKRDIRLDDHAPLSEAAQQGPFIALYVYEPIVWQSPEADVCQLEFINEALLGLDRKLKMLGGRVVFRAGDVLSVLKKLHQQHPVRKMWSHEETGTMATYQRDLLVKRWCRSQGIQWREFPQNGVVRRLATRDGWAEIWQKRMRAPMIAPPDRIEDVPEIESEHPRSADQLTMVSSVAKERQIGGEDRANETLETFLFQRGMNYRHEMSSPVTAHHSCARISPYLAWGCISIKKVHQRLASRVEELRTLKSSRADMAATGQWLKSLSSFQSRLHWHCHFIQKLEDEPELEFQNLSRAFDGLRENDWNEERFQAWCVGKTGYPMIDACMRSVKATGWLNFRMRAMLVSFAANHLWLHWRKPAIFLAQHFLDFEPGIHYPQFQMQSGTTGINTLRIYSPAKQAKDHDPTGSFIRRWVPELEEVPDKFLAEPHLMPTALQLMVGCRLGKDYPAPIVEHASAYQHAKERLYAIRKTDEARREAETVVKKHGSRKGPNDRRPRTKGSTAKNSKRQPKLDEKGPLKPET
jgi:deoxyribodipyrimidine photo-lyase